MLLEAGLSKLEPPGPVTSELEPLEAGEFKSASVRSNRATRVCAAEGGDAQFGPSDPEQLREMVTKKGAISRSHRHLSVFIRTNTTHVRAAQPVLFDLDSRVAPSEALESLWPSGIEGADPVPPKTGPGQSNVDQKAG